MKHHTYALKCFAALVAGTVLTLMPVRAVDFHVATGQDLQNALTLAAVNGADDNIYLTNGYYIGNFNFNSSEAKNLVILPAVGLATTNIVIDGAGGGRSMSISSSASANIITVRGITFLRNCGAGDKGALRIAAGATADIIVDGCGFVSPTNSSGMGLEIVSGLNATVSGCTATGVTGGGGVGISISGVTANVSVQTCMVATNAGGGLSISGGSVVTVTGNTFTGNSGRGGGVNISGSTMVTLSGNTFSANAGDGGGGGRISGTTVTLNNNTFSGNVTWTGGGGGASVSGTTVNLNNNSFIGNGYTAWCYGGGVYINGTTVTVSNNIFSANRASFMANTGGGGVYFSGGTITLNNNSFDGNSALSGCGGGAYCSGTVTLSGNTLKLNTAPTGGGLYTDGPTVRLLNNLLVKNSQSSSSSKGGGVWVRATTLLDMINNTITDNTAAGSGGGVAFQVDGVTEVLHVYNNIIWGNTADATGADVHLIGTGSRKEFLFNNAHGMYGVWDIAVNNLDLAPLFFDPVNGDYHLRSTSPCVNAGTNGAPQLPATDLDGGERVANGTVDMGCYEFGNTIPHPADVNTDWVISDAEYTAYAAAWKNDQTWSPGPVPIPADYVTRAGYLKSQSGGAYHNDGSTRPVCWKPGAP